jgi:hypothetical protein
MGEEATTALWFLRISELLRKEYETSSEASRRVIALTRAVGETDPTVDARSERYYTELTNQRAPVESEVSAQLDDVVRRLREAVGSLRTDA